MAFEDKIIYIISKTKLCSPQIHMLWIKNVKGISM